MDMYRRTPHGVRELKHAGLAAAIVAGSVAPLTGCVN